MTQTGYTFRIQLELVTIVRTLVPDEVAHGCFILRLPISFLVKIVCTIEYVFEKYKKKYKQFISVNLSSAFNIQYNKHHQKYECR